MEILVYAISFALFISLIIFPIFILNKLYKRRIKNTLFSYLAISLITTFCLCLFIAWWSNFSKEILLSHYGYDFDPMNDHLKNVKIENLNRVKSLRKSIMGVGWPLKAFFIFPVYSIYLFIIYPVYFLNKNKTIAA